MQLCSKKIIIRLATILTFSFAIIGLSFFTFSSKVNAEAALTVVQVTIHGATVGQSYYTKIDVKSKGIDTSVSGSTNSVSSGLTTTGTIQATSPTVVADKSDMTLRTVFNNLVAGNNYEACISGTTNCTSFQASDNVLLPTTVTIDTSSNSASQFLLNGDGKTSCNIDGIGWIICPVVNFMAKVADGAFVFLSDNFLKTSPQIFTVTGTNGVNPTFSAWSTMRNIANIAFVIVFLIIIFSQISSFGITNYGIKKMLPRLVIAAILVNLSYYICQIAVDLSNILGYSLKDLLAGLVTTDKSQATAWSSGNLWSGLAVGILAAGVGVAAIWGAIALLVPALIAAVVALVMILFILVARQALIILLIVISPLAFVAFLLPNTSGWFDKWRKTFTAMLMLFPVIAVVFGASSLASAILGSTFEVTDGTNAWMGQIIASLILVVPLFIVPGLLKKSLEAIPMVGQLASKWSDKANANMSNKFGEAYKGGDYARSKVARESYRKMYRDQQYAARLGSKSITGVVSRGVSGNLQRIPGMSKLDPAGQFANERLATFAAAASDKITSESIANREAAIRNSAADKKMFGANATNFFGEQFKQSLRDNDRIGARAAQRILLASGGPGKDMIHTVLKDVTEGEVNRKNIIINKEEDPATGEMVEFEDVVKREDPTVDISNDDTQKLLGTLRGDLLASGIKGSDAVLDKWSVGGGTISQIDISPEVFSGLSPEELSGQSKSTLETAAINGLVSSQSANTLLSNPNSASKLGAPKRMILRAIRAANGAPINRATLKVQMDKGEDKFDESVFGNGGQTQPDNQNPSSGNNDGSGLPTIQW